VVARSDASAALAEAQHIKPDAAIVDLMYLEAATVLSEIAAADPQCPVILMARNQSVDAAISALKAGALDYLAKPFDRERLRDVLVTVRKRVERRETLLRIDADVAKQFEFYGMVGRSPAMQELFDTIRRLAPHLRTVLVTGETGTGKELVAKALHRLGPRRDKRLITLNCSAVVENAFRERAVRDTCAARSPARPKPRWASSSTPIPARSFWTRWGSCRCRSRPSCCALSSTAKCSGWVRSIRAALTCA
jgi:DNA-binding NtrC family response regulator